MGTIEQGVKQAVENCLKVQTGEKAVVITDTETLAIGSALKTAIEKITGQVQFFVMEDFGERPIAYPEAIDEAIQAADVSVYAAQGAKGELQTFRMHLLKAIEANGKLRHAHMIGITPQIMEQGMCSDYSEIQRISKLVYEKVKNAREIRVVTGKGGDFTAEFSPELHWIISDGDITPGHWKNLPDGIVEVKDGRAIEESLECNDEKLKQEFAKYLFETDENSHRVGEFAIGTNTGLTELIYNLLQDEKFPGVHVAFGSPLPGKTGADWNSKAHVDGVIRNPTIHVDGDIIMDKGTFRLEEAV